MRVLRFTQVDPRLLERGTLGVGAWQLFDEPDKCPTATSNHEIAKSPHHEIQRPPASVILRSTRSCSQC